MQYKYNNVRKKNLLSLFNFNVSLQRNNAITYNRQHFYMCTSELILKNLNKLEWGFF